MPKLIFVENSNSSENNKQNLSNVNISSTRWKTSSNLNVLIYQLGCKKMIFLGQILIFLFFLIRGWSEDFKKIC